MKRFTLQSKKFQTILVLFFWIAIWQILFELIQKEILFVSPFHVIVAFLELIDEAAFWLSIIFSVGRMLLGYIFAVIFGIFTALLTTKIQLLDKLLQPLFSAIRATPVVSFSLLVLLWMRTDMVPVIISFLMVFPLIWSNTCQGIRSVNQEYLEMTQVYGFSTKQILKLLYLPTILPPLFTACKTGVGLAWKSGVAAEVICTPKFSIGKKLYETKLYLDTPALFAWTIVVILLSIAVEKFLEWGITKMQNKMRIKI